jgi:predicted transcriptional regulator
VISVADVLKAIADDKSVALFNTIALYNGESEIFISKLKLTRKQFYSRLHVMQSVGLVKREKGRYSLTLLGKILYQAQELIGKGVSCYWNLKAIDSIRTSDNDRVPEEQFLRIIDNLVSDQEIKDILLKPSKELLEGEVLPNIRSRMK